MARRAKPAKAKVEAKPAGKSPKSDDARVRDLEKRLTGALRRDAEASKREAEALAQLQGRDRELAEAREQLTAAHAQVTEALEQQTATSAILTVIASSPTDVQPVLDAVAENAARLCHTEDASILQADGGVFRVMAYRGAARLKDFEGTQVSRGSVAGRAILDRQVVHVHNITQESDAEFSVSKALMEHFGHSTMLAAPLLRQGTAIGAIFVRRTQVDPFSDRQIALLQTFADQAVIAIENVRLFRELGARNRDLTEALDQRTATGEILETMSASLTDVQPVFDAIARNAQRLLRGHTVSVTRLVGEELQLMSYNTTSPAADDVMRALHPILLDRVPTAAHAVRERTPAMVSDIETDPTVTESQREVGRARGFRSFVYIPMVRDDVAIGLIAVTRQEAGAFADGDIALLKTFADQAVIAIENVRLFIELQEKNQALTQAHAQVTESLEQQTATSDILRVISSSPTTLEPVLQAVVKTAARLCEASNASLYRIEGELMRKVAGHGSVRTALQVGDTRPVTRGSVGGRAMMERRTLHIADVLAELDAEYPLGRDAARREGVRTFVATPLLREGMPIGVITVYRTEVRPFSDKQIELLQTFADQAVIAIENVRLFTELQARNRELTATSDILLVIASSPTDVQPVFDTIADRSMRLCEAAYGWVMTFDGELLHLRSLANVSPSGVDALRQNFPVAPSRGFAAGRSILTAEVVQTPDVVADPEYEVNAKVAAQAAHYRSVLTVPLLHHGRPIGVILVSRPEPGPFSEEQIQLLKTFASQAVIAIENVRLFTELQARNRDLSEALERQTATADILRVISQAQTDVQPVFDAIADSALRLLGAWATAVTRYDGELITLAAARGGLPGSAEVVRERFQPPHRPTFAHEQPVLTGRVHHVVDVETDPSCSVEFRHHAAQRGIRSFVAVPMLRGSDPLGIVGVSLAQPGGFSPAEIALLQTFADQAVIAIENTRLLGELRARTAELTRSVDELTALGDVSRALSATLDLDAVLRTIVTRVGQLAGTDACSVFEYDEATEAFYLRATNNLDEEVVTLVRQTPTRKGEGVQGRMAVTRQPVQVPDIAEEEAYRGPLRDLLLRTGTRAVLAIPLLRERELIGGLVVNKRMPGEFPPEVIQLLTTFATQSALAIQNARLFREIEDKSRQLEAASRHKSEFLANMSHELRTPLNAVIGFSEVLLQRMFGALNDKQDEYLKDIYASGQHLLSLINDILDLSKIEAGRMELAPAAFHLPTALENALTLVRERANRHSIALELDLDPRLGELVGDERKVKQVVLNLLSNAVKFTPEGGRISLKAARKDGAVEIAVIDTGIGIAPEDQAAIFEEFRQVGSDERRREGTGLGLTLAKKFVELHGGRIWVESAAGRGSTFTFTLPAA